MEKTQLVKAEPSALKRLLTEEIRGVTRRGAGPCVGEKTLAGARASHEECGREMQGLRASVQP